MVSLVGMYLVGRYWVRIIIKFKLSRLSTNKCVVLVGLDCLEVIWHSVHHAPLGAYRKMGGPSREDGRVRAKRSLSIGSLL